MATSIGTGVDRIQDLTRQIDARMTEYENIKKLATSEGRLLNEEERAKCINIQKEVVDLTKERNIEQDEIEVRETLNTSYRPPTKPALPTEDELQKRYNHLPPKEDRYTNLGEFIADTIQSDARMKGSLTRKLTANVAMTRALGMSETSPTDGGFLVQPDQSARLIEPMFDGPSADAILSRLSRTSVTGNGLKFNAIDETSRATTNWGGIVMYWLGEGAVKTPSHPKLREVELKLKKIAGVCYLTDELMQDAPALSSRIERGFQVALKSALIRAIVRGTGAGQPLGLITSPARIAVAAEVGQDPDTIVTENIVKMYTALDPNAVSPVWLYNRSAFPQLFPLSITLGAAGTLVNLPAGGIAVSPNQTLLGLPLIPCPWCSALGDEGDIILVDLSQYEFIDKGGPQVAYSIHVKFLYDETAMRIVYRCDGQPAVVSATTLEDAVSTVSPIVTLAAR